MRRAAVVLTLLVLLASVGSARGAAPEWRSQQPLGPQGRTPLGEVGDVECWSANRCLLITAGNGGMPAGLYAYDGSGWYLYSTVCGGHQGRIAWAGPTEFWTISDQPLGQVGAENAKTEHVSLCHFKDGAVLTSYAEPLGVAGSYLQMNAAACLIPGECWFAGERLPGTVNVGAFHLFWNSLSLAAVPSLTQAQPEVEDPGRSVFSLAYHQGSLYESVLVQPGDEAAGEPADQPYFLHRVLPGAPPSFVPEVPATPIDYGGEGAGPGGLEGFHLSDDGEGLWAVSGTTEAPAKVTVLRLVSGAFEQLSLDESSPVFSPGDEVTGLAAEPGAADSWVGFRHRSDQESSPARVALVHADGTVDPAQTLAVEGEGVGNVGRAGPLACAAPGQCWMATKKGWLFHLGPDPAPNADPALHNLITVRPPDASQRSVPPTSLPEDTSGANPERLEEELPGSQEEPLPRHLPALLVKLHQRLVGSRTLELTFVLRAKAHVRLLARRQGRVVAKTGRLTLPKGPQVVHLRLDPDRWPTKLDLQVHAVKKRKAK